MANHKLVYGNGINDIDDPITWYDDQGKRVICPIYSRWRGMLLRCYGEASLKVRPSYKGCKVSESFLKRSEFAKWYKENFVEDYALDKDLLSYGKLYSPETCVFIPKSINSFIADFNKRSDKNLKLPSGIHFNKEKNLFCARGCNPFLAKKYSHLGYFKTSQEAFLAWLNFKNSVALEFCKKYPELPEKVRKALLKRYTLKHFNEKVLNQEEVHL